MIRKGEGKNKHGEKEHGKEKGGEGRGGTGAEEGRSWREGSAWREKGNIENGRKMDMK